MKKTLLAAIFSISCLVAFAQSPVKEYVDKAGVEKIKKQILVEAKPITANGYDDGHGRNPYLSNVNQLPDTLALITFYIYDQGVEYKSGNTLYSYSLSENGGNYVANAIHKNVIAQLKETYKKLGVVLLTPEEFLNTEEKRNFYNAFKPEISKIGKFLSNLENRATDVAVAADFYRGFDLSAAFDHERSTSLGSELASKLGVNGVLSLGIELISNKKEINVSGVRMAINGPNPIPKQDKKYISQNLGAGYYPGQHYFGGRFTFKSPQLIGEIKKGQITSENYDGLHVIFSCLAEVADETMREAITKNSK